MNLSACSSTIAPELRTLIFEKYSLELLQEP
jgi:hypothetical protein